MKYIITHPTYPGVYFNYDLYLFNSADYKFAGTFGGEGIETPLNIGICRLILRQWNLSTYRINEGVIHICK